MSKATVKRGLEQLAEIMAGPPGHTDKTLARQEKIRQAGLKETRMIYAKIDREEYCLDQLPNLDEEDEDSDPLP